MQALFSTKPAMFSQGKLKKLLFFLEALESL